MEQEAKLKKETQLNCLNSTLSTHSDITRYRGALAPFCKISQATHNIYIYLRDGDCHRANFCMRLLRIARRIELNQNPNFDHAHLNLSSYSGHE